MRPKRSYYHNHLSGRLIWSIGVSLSLAASLIGSGTLAQSPAGGVQSSSADRMLTTLSRRGDLTLRDTTLESALFTISELWNINIVAGKIEGSVNGVFKDAPLKEILDSILQSNGYAYRPVGGSLIVSRLEDLGQVNPFFVSQTIPVGAAEVGEVVEAARLLSTPKGQVRAVPSAGAVLVVDFPERVEKIRDLVSQLDSATRTLTDPSGGGQGPRQREVAYFRTHYVPALQAGTALEVVLSADGRVAAVEGDDRLLVVDYPEHVRMVEAVLARLDRPRPQVKIRSLIYDISLTDLEDIGINWNGITNGTIDQTTGIATGQNSGLRFLSQTAPDFDESGTGSSFSFFTFDGNVNLSAVVVALQQAEDSRLLADPNVTVMDNESANIESISEVPYQELTQTTGGGNIGTTAFKEVGIKLDVVPKISCDGTIDLTVIPEFSRLAGFTPGTDQPIIDTRRATTRVRVRDRQTLMIAGLRQRSDVGDFDGVPLLKDIRFLGHLFRSRKTEVTESELVVFLTPEIVGYSDPLGTRDRLTADTINCRLDYIPAAEGCPHCGTQGSCNCVGTPIETVITMPLEQPADPTLADPASTPGPSLQPAEKLPAEVLEDTPIDQRSLPIEIQTIPSARTTPANAEDLSHSLSAKNGVRRLPPTDSVLPAAKVDLASRVETQSNAAEQPLRATYGDRFRATGGVYEGSQRLAERPTGIGSSPKKESSEKDKSKDPRSFRDWIFRR